LPQKHFYEFGPYRIDVALSRLERGGDVVTIPPKAFDLLLLLARNHHRVLSKTELMEALWPKTFVEEANLTQHVYTLRKALGEQPGGAPYIETVPRRGYRLAADVREVQADPAALAAPPAPPADSASLRQRAVTPVVLDGERKQATVLHCGVANAAALAERLGPAGLIEMTARLLGGDTHVADKVMSVFEPHTEGIRKGKIATPTEFGKLVTIQEAEHQIVTAYEVHARRPADKTLWVPALDRHQQIFGRAPDLAAGDRGFASAANEGAAYARGVRRVVLPQAGRKTPARRAYERQRWFRRGQRWRVGCEGRISVLKRRHGLRRSRYRGADGISRWVGLGVIANNLVSAATVLRQRTAA